MRFRILFHKVKCLGALLVAHWDSLEVKGPRSHSDDACGQTLGIEPRPVIERYLSYRRPTLFVRCDGSVECRWQAPAHQGAAAQL